MFFTTNSTRYRSVMRRVRFSGSVVINCRHLRNFISFFFFPFLSMSRAYFFFFFSSSVFGVIIIIIIMSNGVFTRVTLRRKRRRQSKWNKLHQKWNLRRERNKPWVDLVCPEPGFCHHNVCNRIWAAIRGNDTPTVSDAKACVYDRVWWKCDFWRAVHECWLKAGNR